MRLRGYREQIKSVPFYYTLVFSIIFLLVNESKGDSNYGQEKI